MFTPLLNPILAIMSLSTAAGVLIHDTRIDKAASAAFALPAAVMSVDATSKLAGLASDLHTHVERGSIAQAVNDLRTQNPRIQPRSNDDRKHMMQKHVARGHHAFDNYSLPLV
jgi:hypothetical protein